MTGQVFGLDLLRAVAILLVLLSHWSGHFGYWFGARVPAVMDIAGDTGVELFFALSGFLIGRILIGIVSLAPTWRDYRVFMLRRAMRTLPLYFLWLGLLICVFPPQHDVMQTALRFITLTQNLLTPMPPDYYYAVTWSLTIEEWFYFLFGAALITLARRLNGSRALACCLAAFMLGPLALRLAFMERGALVFFRIDEIAYGVTMAWLFRRGNWLFSHPLPPLAVGLTLIGAALSSLLPIPPGLTIPLTSNAEVIGCALCLPAALRLQGCYAGWFGTTVRWIAARSYALYLFHLTVLADVAERLLFETGRLPAAGCVLIAVVAPFVMAELSYRLVEAPILRRRPDQKSARPRTVTRFGGEHGTIVPTA